MKTLNEVYNKSCRPGYQNYKKITDQIILIDNFFEDFDSARNFFISRDKWDCILYQNYAKPGKESKFPSWTGKSLMEKYILDNKISEDMNSYEIECNFFNHSDSFVWSLTNSCYYPHFDGVEDDGILNFICLINLNLVSVTTKFYSYKNKEYCDKNQQDEWAKYEVELFTEIQEYYNCKYLKRNQIKEFLEKKEDLKVKLIKEVEYKPNQAIVYAGNLFHSPHVTEEFTEDNPRVLLRIMFSQKTTKNKKIIYQ